MERNKKLLKGGNKMDIRNLQHEKALVAIIFDRDTMIEQLGAQITQVMKENEDLKKEKEDVKKDGKKT